MSNPMNELWQAQQDAATRMAESWRTLLQPAADRTARPPAPPETTPSRPEPVDTGTVDTGTVDTGTDTGGDDTGTDDTVGSEITGYEIADSEPTAEVVEPEPAALGAIHAIQALGDGQRDFAGQMARWAQLQHELADAMTTWARHQQDCADALDRALVPFGPGTAGRSV